MPSDVQIRGRSGPLVLLLSGGAEAVDGFFPGLEEGLIADPGCRVIIHDRPGTGTSTEPGLLADAADHLSGVIADLGEGPVIVVGQSLGGAVAMLLAVKHPEAVAGLVLLDPTPINDPTICGRTEKVMRTLKRMDAIPGMRGLVRSTLRREAQRNMRGKNLRPDCQAALEKIAALDVPRLADAVVGLGELSAGFRDDAIPHVPVVVFTADRKPDSTIRRAHLRTAKALGVDAVTWPGSDHNVQLTNPDETLATVRELVGIVSAKSA